MPLPNEIGSYYNFSTYGSPVIGSELKNVLLVGIFDFNIANMHENVVALSEAIKPHLPESLREHLDYTKSHTKVCYPLYFPLPFQLLSKF
jgi:hypothetical protein